MTSMDKPLKHNKHAPKLAAKIITPKSLLKPSDVMIKQKSRNNVPCKVNSHRNYNESQSRQPSLI